MLNGSVLAKIDGFKFKKAVSIKLSNTPSEAGPTIWMLIRRGRG